MAEATQRWTRVGALAGALVALASAAHSAPHEAAYLTRDCAPPRNCAATAPGPGIAATEPWSANRESVTRDIREGKPLLISVMVPLCSNEQIDCGSAIAGRPADLAHNLYWGAVYGARRHFDSPKSGWERVEVTGADGPVLERVVYRRWVPGARWGATQDRVETVLVLHAVHGANIGTAATRFWELASGGGKIAFLDGGRPRSLTVHVAGYAGHNFLAPGYRRFLREFETREGEGFNPLPSFALGCKTGPSVGHRLLALGSHALLLTDANMAPEGYVIDAVARGLGDNLSPVSLRQLTATRYAAYQRIPLQQAKRIFSRAR